MYYERSIEGRVKAALGVMPAVFVNGPRQAGKSTLAQHLSRAQLSAEYVTFDDITAYAGAAQDPEGFLRRIATPAILDEVQRVPDLFRVLKQIVDERRRREGARANGTFLLTGSANVLALPGLSDALVGRMAILTLYPLSAGEALGRPKPVINGLFDLEIGHKKSVAARRMQLDDIIHRATFPGISGAPRADGRLWFDGYLSTLLQRDVRQLAEIENVPALSNMVKVLAARAGGLLNDADCARDAKLNPMTYRRYRILLQQLFLIATVAPWHRNIGKRLVKSPKVYFTDTALLCHQLGVELAGLRRHNPGLFGHVIENFVASELTKQLSMIPDGALHHFRAHDGSEVDFVIERRNGKLLGIEVKARESAQPDDFSRLKILKEQVGADFVRGIVLYLGRDAVPFGPDMVAMPIESLWELDVDVRVEERIEHSADLNAYVCWANYGDSTRVRCVLPWETIADAFRLRSGRAAALAAIRRHWSEISRMLTDKLARGEIESVIHDHGRQFGGDRHATIRQVTLRPSDFPDARRS